MRCARWTCSEVHDALDYLGCRAEVLTVDPHRLTEVLDVDRGAGRGHRHRRHAPRSWWPALPPGWTGAGPRVAGRPPAPTLVLEWTDPPVRPGPLGARHGHGRRWGERCWAPRARSFRAAWEQVTASRRGDRVRPVRVRVGRLVPVGGWQAAWRRGCCRRGCRCGRWTPNASFARPGPRLVDGVEALAGILHPDVAGRAGSGHGARGAPVTSRLVPVRTGSGGPGAATGR